MPLHLGQRAADDDFNANDSDELLTSYLDGELGNEDRRVLELRLAKDSGLRLRLAELRLAYDWLDDLPETPHDQRFTQSTIEHVVKSVRDDPSRQSQTQALSLEAAITPANSMWWRKWPFRFPALLLCCVLLGTAAGFVARDIAINNEVKNFSLVANLNGLQFVSDAEVARALSVEQVALGMLKERFSRRFFANVPDDLREFPRWVEALSPLQKTEIFRNREAYARLGNDKLSELREVNTQLLADEQSDTLQETVRLVGLVVDRMSPNDRLPLVGMSPEERITYLREKIYFFAADHYFANDISEADSLAIEQWFDVARYEIETQLGFFRGMRSRGPNGELTPERRESLINFYSASLFSPSSLRDEEQVASLLDELRKELSDIGAKLLSELTPTDQLLIVFTVLAPNRVGSDGHFMERYLRASPQFKELLDLSSPADIRSMILQEPLRPNR